MTRQEAYNIISKNQPLKDEIKKKYNRPYTSVSTENLIEFINSRNSKSNTGVQEVKKVQDKKPAPDNSSALANEKQSEKKPKKLDNKERMTIARDLLNIIKTLEKRLATLKKYKEYIEKIDTSEMDELPVLFQARGYFRYSDFNTCTNEDLWFDPNDDDNIHIVYVKTPAVISLYLKYIDIDSKNTEDELKNTQKQFSNL